MTDKNYSGDWRAVPTTEAIFTVDEDPEILPALEGSDARCLEFWAHTNEGDYRLRYKFRSFDNDAACARLRDDVMAGDSLSIKARVYPGYFRPIRFAWYADPVQQQ